MADHVIQVLKQAGFKGEALRQAWAIVMRESGGAARAYNPNRSTGDDSRGFFQINMLGGMGKQRDADFRKHVQGYTGIESLYDPVVNARAAYRMSKGGTNWYHWDIDKNGYNGGTHAGAYQKWYAKFPGDDGTTTTDQTAAADTTVYDQPTDSLNMADLKGQYGIAAAVLKKNPDLQKVLQRILDGKVTDPNRQLAMLQETQWFQQHTSDWLAIEKSRLSKDPALWSAMIDKKAQEIIKGFTAAGAPIDEKTARKYATQMTYGSGWNGSSFEIYDEAWLKSSIADAIDYTKTKTVNGVNVSDLSGQAQDFATQLNSAAHEYGVTASMSDAGYKAWFTKSMHGLMDGSIATQDVTDELMNRALSLFPGMAPQLQRGLTLRQAADPYLKTIADTLELDPTQIDLHDDLVQRALNSTDQTGAFKPISLYDTKLLARKDERFQHTSKAKQEYTDIGSKILTDFGFLG